MNLAIHGLSGEIMEANSYYEDPYDCVGRFDFVMANPPFNVDGVDKGRLAMDQRFPLGRPQRGVEQLDPNVVGVVRVRQGRAAPAS